MATKRVVAPPLRIVSGGQTGVDRAALDAALAVGVPVGGWCPRGRRAEDGRIAERYPLRETATADYAERTRLNVRDSDATLIIGVPGASAGTRLTAGEARRLGKPLLQWGFDEPIARIRDWLHVNDIRVLNVAGPRESEAPGIYERTRAVMAAVLTRRHRGA